MSPATMTNFLKPGWLKRQLNSVRKDADARQWLIDNGYGVSHGAWNGEESPYYSTLDHHKIVRDLKEALRHD